MPTIDHILSKYTTDIDNTIQGVLEDSSDFMRGMISYHLGWVDQTFKPVNVSRGKMFRPTLSLLVFEALTGNYKKALPVAAAVEMIHNFSRMHDDIEDNDVERRGRPSAWTVWGKPRVINAGDFLYSLAYKSLYQLDLNHFAPEQILAVLRLINQACLALTEGQDLDLQFEKLQEVSVEMYLDMVYKKTGALVEAAILSGATLGTTDERIIQNYHEFAQNIGIAFQIRDDMLGIWGDASKTGKSASNDLRRKKKTLPVLCLLERASAERREKLKRYYAHSDPLADEEIQFVRESLAEVDAYGYTQQMADTYREKAFSALHRISIANQAQSELEVITRFLVDRTY
jgi:geranylgeranyl diphosphate synthase type I